MLALMPALVAASCGRPFAQCEKNMTCIQLTPYHDKPFVYDCAVFLPTTPSKGDVYFLHGNDGPLSKGMYALMMQSVAAAGYSTLACDQRGFSPGASPYNESSYDYDLLVEDIFAIADSHFGKGGKFHVVGHDQGARIAWHALAGSRARSRFASFTALSIPHLDAFSDMMYGDNPEPVQQKNYAYVRLLTLPNSVEAYQQNIWNQICKEGRELGYKKPEDCQPAMWWYNGAYSAGAIALQPFDGFGPVGQQIGIPESYVKANSPYSLDGFPQTSKIGKVTELPVQYICGPGETADLCNDRAKDDTAKYVTQFTYLRAQGCAHCLTDPGECPQYQQVTDAVVRQIQSVA